MQTIIAEVYPSKRLLLKKSWRIRFIGNNGEKIGHEYNSAQNALEGIYLMIDPEIVVILRAPGHPDKRIR